AVANGFVYVGSNRGYLFAFDAAGIPGCSGSPKTCYPRWIAPTGDAITSAPTVWNGRLYVVVANSLWAYDAAGVLGCGGTPKQCYPLWSGATLGGLMASPTIAGSTVLAASQDGNIWAFDAAGVQGCGGIPVQCDPRWRGFVAAPIHSSPAVANGVVIFASGDGYLWAFSAGGTTGCGGTPRVCNPLLRQKANAWSSSACPTGNKAVSSSPAISDGRVFIGSGDCELHAFTLP
ncbi:MAG: PQQ-binding-like beta-propeller repeat protein, partial [Actinomycetota bacterium]